jgi:hypothetical protein
LLKSLFFHSDDILTSPVSKAHRHNKQTNTDITAHHKHSPGIADIWQLLQETALPEDSFPELNPNNSENEEHEKTKKQHIA